MKFGRNDPCPCGSGKKYKKCCLRNEGVATPERNVWRVVQDGMREASRLLSRDFHQVYGDGALEEAWLAFNLWPEEDELEPLDPQLREADAFTHWLFFTWAPDPKETVVTDESLHDVVPAQMFLSRHGAQLTPILLEYVQSCIDASWSFYRVERVEAGQRFTLRDLVIDSLHEVYAPYAANHLRDGDEVYGSLITVAGVHLAGNLQRVSFMAHDLETLDVLRKRTASHAIDTTPEALAAELPGCDDEVRELYLLLTGMLPAPVILQSGFTDPNELILHELVYDIGSPQLAWDALKHLHPDNLESPLLERNDAGQIRRASLLWRDADAVSNTPDEQVLGSIDIEDKTLTVHTSGEYAWQAKDIIEDALGEHARFRKEDTQDIDSVLASMADDPDLMDIFDEDDIFGEDDIEEICEDLRHDYKALTDTPLSQLDERTPRECVKTPEGRRRVDMLLGLAQEHAQEWPAEHRKKVFGGIRKQLGLLD